MKQIDYAIQLLTMVL